MIVRVEHYRIDASKATILAADGAVFVARWLDKPSVWLRFLKKRQDPGFWVSAYKTRREAMEGWGRPVRDPEGRFVPWLLQLPEVTG